MCRKLFVTAGGALLLVSLVWGTSAGSYLATGWHRIRDAAKSQVPIEFEIDRARDMIDDLVPDIRQNMHTIAKEEVEVARLATQVEALETRLAEDKAELMTLREDVASGKKTFHYAGRSYSADQVRTDLARRFERYKTSDATLASLREMLAARERSLEGARQKLEGMLAAKRQLEVEVEHLEARLQIVQAAQTTSDCTFDDSQLARTRELITDLRTRLEVAERLVDSEGQFHDEIPLEVPASTNVLEEMTRYFGGGEPRVAEAR